MDYYERENSLIELAELDPKIVHGTNLSECADALMDGCAEELTGIDPASLSPECRARVARVIAAIRGVGLPPATM